MLVQEVFSRNLRDREAVARYAGRGGQIIVAAPAGGLIDRHRDHRRQVGFGHGEIDITGLRLILIGQAIEHAGVARQAVVEAGLRGLGPDRGALHLLAVDPATLPQAAPCPARVAIELLTPVRLVEAGRLLGLAALRPRHLLLSLLRRVSTPAERHGPAPLDLDYSALKKRAEATEFTAAELRWVEWARWSGRQQALLTMGGLLGVLALPLAGLEPFWPFLALAPRVHAEKGATMGLGAMRVVPA